MSDMRADDDTSARVVEISPPKKKAPLPMRCTSTRSGCHDPAMIRIPFTCLPQTRAENELLVIAQQAPDKAGGRR